MNTKKWSVIALATLVALPVSSSSAQSPPATGHVLVLENERVLEGDIVRDGDQYRIRHRVGETTVPANSVLALCADMKEAYTRVHKRSNLEDPDERMRLAFWCRVHGLHAEAISELRAAPRARSGSRRSSAAVEGAPGRASSSSGPGQAPAPRGPEPMADISAEAMSLFTTRIQPILMNTCVRCHARDNAGTFHLTRVFGNPGITQPACRHNLAVTLAQINRQHPEASPLLLKALSLHGMSDRPPLKDRKTPAYRQLATWVWLQAQSTPAVEETEARVENGPAARDVLPAAPTPVSQPAPVDAPTPFAGDRKAGRSRAAGREPPSIPSIQSCSMNWPTLRKRGRADRRPHISDSTALAERGQDLLGSADSVIKRLFEQAEAAQVGVRKWMPPSGLRASARALPQRKPGRGRIIACPQRITSSRSTSE